MGRKRKTGCENKNLRADTIEKYVIDKIKSDILSDTAIARILTEIDSIIKSKTDTNTEEKKELIKKQNEIQNKIDKTFDLYYVDDINKKMVSLKLAELKNNLALIESRINQNKSSVLNVSQLEEIKKMLINFRSSFDESDPMILKIAIDTFVQKIFVSLDDVKVIFKINISPTPPRSGSVSDKGGGGEGSRTSLMYISLSHFISQIVLFNHLFCSIL